MSTSTIILRKLYLQLSSKSAHAHYYTLLFSLNIQTAKRNNLHNLINEANAYTECDIGTSAQII